MYAEVVTPMSIFYEGAKLCRNDFDVCLKHWGEYYLLCMSTRSVLISIDLNDVLRYNDILYRSSLIFAQFENVKF